MATVQEDTFTIPRQVKRTQLKEEKPCSLDGCEGFQWSRGYCSMHYTRLRKAGTLKTRKAWEDAPERFKSSYEVNPVTGCWEWTGCRGDKGYAAFPVGDKVHRGHRYSYENFVGKIPKGQMVLHRCDNPPCVNPSHLFLGDNSANMQDCASKGRHFMQQGEPLRILTAPMVWNIRIMFARGEISKRLLAKIYGVSINTITNCLAGKTHRVTRLSRSIPAEFSSR